ncbi:MAG: threonine synthase [Actinomycetota bacterium]|nr:threonine synthase [Actinomycetota bacterium]
MTELICARCGAAYDADHLQNRCRCSGTLLARYDTSAALAEVLARPPGLWRFRELLPVSGDPVSLGEPETPLLFASRLSERFGVEVFIKDDSPLPGGTFKARGAAVGLSRAVELGVKQIVMPSAGNAGGAWALYAARAGIDITVTMARTAPVANQKEVSLAGGNLELVDGTIADAGARAKEIATETGAFLASTFNEPYRVEGKKTAWLETFLQLGDGTSMRFPKTIVLPVGGGVAAVAAVKAAQEVVALGWVSDPSDTPRLVGVQPEDCAPIVRAFERGETQVEPWPGEPSTIAAGLRVPAPSEGDLVLDRVRSSGGTMVAIPEADIVAAVSDLAATEGLFACPEGAATVPAAARLAAAGDLEGPVVLYNTGAGTKYLDLL